MVCLLVVLVLVVAAEVWSGTEAFWGGRGSFLPRSKNPGCTYEYHQMYCRGRASPFGWRKGPIADCCNERPFSGP